MGRIDKVLFREHCRPIVSKKINEFNGYKSTENNPIMDIKFAKGYLSDLILDTCFEIFDSVSFDDKVIR